MSNLRALYATCDTPGGKRTYRIGLPASEAVIWKRYERFDAAHYRNRRHLTVCLRNGQSYPVLYLEVRDVDAQGRGLGGERHWSAYGVPVSALVIQPDGPHVITYHDSKAWRVTGRCSAVLTSKRGAVVGYGRHTLDARLSALREARQRALI